MSRRLTRALWPLLIAAIAAPAPGLAVGPNASQPPSGEPPIVALTGAAIVLPRGPDFKDHRESGGAADG